VCEFLCSPDVLKSLVGLSLGVSVRVGSDGIQRVQWLAKNDGPDIIVGGKRRDLSVLQLVQIGQFALADLFVLGFEEAYLQLDEVHLFVHRFDETCAVGGERIESWRYFRRVLGFARRFSIRAGRPGGGSERREPLPFAFGLCQLQS